MLKAQIVEVFTVNGIEYTKVKCPYCDGRFHTHGKIDPARPVRMSHCRSPFKGREYIVVSEAVEVTK